ncbi:MAG: hypothetical protein GY810_08100 [Aureispira sp.]|nr:hypothetical protein [Aureispira sp.]
MKQYIFSTIFMVISFSISAQPKQLKTDVEQAIQNGQKWMKNNKASLGIESYIVYNLLERRFQQPKVANKKQLLSDNEEEAKALKPFYRLMDNNASLTKEELAKVEGRIDKLVTKAIWCDQYPLPDNYLADLEVLYLRGKHRLTHAYLATLFIQENNNSIIETAEYKELEQKITKSMQEFLTSNDVTSDVWIEAIALMLYAGQHQKISDAYIQRVLEAQDASTGGWKNYPNSAETNHHTTALALWALLEYNNKPIKNIRWIQH